MATITATSIIEKGALVLQDVEHNYWLESELQGWLNDAQRAIVLVKPDAYTVTEAVACVAGTKQELPAAGIRLIDVKRNMGAAGSTPGRAIRLCTDVDSMNINKADWHSEAAAGAAKNFFFDRRNPKVFYIYPQIGTNFLELVYTAIPAECAAAGSAWAATTAYALGAKVKETPDATEYVYECVQAGTSEAAENKPTFPETLKEAVSEKAAGTGPIWQNIGKTLITLDDSYEGALLDYMLYRAYQKDSENRGNPERSAAFLRSFLSLLGLEDQIEKIIDPNIANFPVTKAVAQALNAQAAQ